jgi:glutathione S-transferase
MAKLKIYGIAKSRAFRTLWVAEEAGVAFDHIQTTFGEDSKQPEFLKVNPMGQVPAIEDDGFTLSESMALNLYIAKKYGKGGLYPSDLQGEAKCWQWAFFAATSLERSMGLFVANRYVLAPEKRSDAVAQENLKAVERPLAALDAQLAKGPYLVGQTFTVADLCVASVLYGAWFNKHDFSSTPKLKDWLERCLTRPGALSARKLREAA